MMAKFRAILVLVLILCFSFCANLGIGEDNRNAREMAESELSKYLVKCGDSWYLMRSWDQLLELKDGGGISIEEIPLSEADKLNRLEFKCRAHYSYATPVRSVGQQEMSPWKESEGGMLFNIRKKNGQWSIEIYSEDYKKITCETVNAWKN